MCLSLSVVGRVSSCDLVPPDADRASRAPLCVPQGWGEDLQRWALVGWIDPGAQMSGDVGREGRVAGW